MALRRGASGLAGILLVDKPVGPTSHDVVAIVRRALGEKRVGHAGTLDPMASGLLVVLVGPYTRLAPFLSSKDKRYDARIVFGTQTDTDDAQGKATDSADIPEAVADPVFATHVLLGFLGESLQIPPAYSAIKQGGHVAHRAARSGTPLEVPPRPVRVLGAELLGIQAHPLSWDVDFIVSKGTYVRALARDIGHAAGTAAHLGALRRTASGPISVDEAHPLQSVAEGEDPSHAARLFADPFMVLGLPVARTDEATVAHGRSFPSDGADGERVAVRVGERLAGVYHRSQGRLVPDVFFPSSAGGPA